MTEEILVHVRSAKGEPALCGLHYVRPSAAMVVEPGDGAPPWTVRSYEVALILENERRDKLRELGHNPSRAVKCPGCHAKLVEPGLWVDIDIAGLLEWIKPDIVEAIEAMFGRAFHSGVENALHQLDPIWLQEQFNSFARKNDLPTQPIRHHHRTTLEELEIRAMQLLVRKIQDPTNRLLKLNLPTWLRDPAPEHRRQAARLMQEVELALSEICREASNGLLNLKPRTP